MATPNTTMTTEARDRLQAEVNRVHEQIDPQRGQRLCYLSGRWRDEREYEDWDDYKAALEKVAVELGGVPKYTRKRPFAVLFTTANTPPGYLIGVRATTTRVETFAERG